MIRKPAKNPCGSCPYRKDVPSGVWDESEYVKLPQYDGQTFEQPPAAFLCHQQNSRICGGWAGCHDMSDNLGLRLAVATGAMLYEEAAATVNYETDVPLFESGQAACDHGMAKVDDPDDEAKKVVAKLERKRSRMANEG